MAALNRKKVVFFISKEYIWNRNNNPALCKTQVTDQKCMLHIAHTHFITIPIINYLFLLNVYTLSHAHF